jgi:hypothetical protein
MPVTYSIDVAQKTIRTRCVGDVKLADVISHFRDLQNDVRCPPHLDVLLDLSETTSLPETSQLSAVTNEIRKIQMKVHFGACAIVATRDALFGMARMFEVMAQPYFRVISVFRALQPAEAFLASQTSSRASAGTLI